jgi:hypothetical protein
MSINNSSLTFDSRDEFNRKSIADKAINLLCSNIDVSPMVIDGGWGTGKSEFCQKLINCMREKNTHQLIYIDAFQADHADEPLLTVLAEVIKILPEEAKNDFMKKALPAVRYGLKTLAKAGVSHLLRQDVADVTNDFDREIQEAADKAIDASVQSLLKDHIKANKSLSELQAAMTKIAAEKPIILFVDELDRCRPDFAVNMLEIIKHTFAVEGVQFILITNTQQLKASINHCYGTTVDAQRYLDKFLKFTFELPQFVNIQKQQYTLVAVSHYQKQISDSDILKSTPLARDSDFLFISHIISTQNLSLREVETLVRYLEIYHQLSERTALADNSSLGNRLLKLLGVALFCFNKNLANSLVQERADAKQLAEWLGVYRLAPMEEGALRADYHEVVTTMLGQECFYNSDMFMPEEGQHKSEWEGLIEEYFSDFNPLRKGKKMMVAVKTINELSLLN